MRLKPTEAIGLRIGINTRQADSTFIKSIR